MGEIYYPGADRSRWYGTRYPGVRFDGVDVVVLHSTEGTGLPPYDGGSKAPTFTAVPDFARQRLVWYQHFKANQSSRALRNEDGGVQTNNRRVVQVEIVGTCDRRNRWSSPHLKMWALPPWAVRDLGKFLRWVHDEWGTPLRYATPWEAYDRFRGQSSGVRMSGREWEAFRGVCGHMHVPENDHRDPGDIPIRSIIESARGCSGVSEQDVIAGLKAKTIRNLNGKDPNTATIGVTVALERADQKLDDLVKLARAQSAAIKALNAALAALTLGTAKDVKAAFAQGVAQIQSELDSIESRLDELAPPAE